MTTVLKLGGSVLTEKDEPETIDRASLTRAAEAVADHVGRPIADRSPDAGAGADLVLVHGGGSFGHYHADRHGLSTSSGSREAEAVRATHDAMVRLDAAVLDALSDLDVPALPVRPLSAARRDRDGELFLLTDQVGTMLAEGFVPMLHGDVVAHAGRGATVVSGDELVVVLARALDAERVGLCTAEPGVRAADGTILERIEEFAEVADAFDEGSTDVTGGMAAKVRTLLALDTPARVFDLDGLAPFLAGEHPGTLID